MRKSFFLLLIFCKDLLGAPPVDISFFVVDLKFNQRQGVKICEVQQGSISRFKGFDFVFGKKGVIGERLCRVLSQYNNSFWFLESALTFPELKGAFQRCRWSSAPSLLELYKTPRFLKLPPKKNKDPNDLRHYRAVVYARLFSEPAVEDFQKRFPDVVLMDRVNIPYLLDKYKMSSLFLKVKAKPKWNRYHKKYHEGLAKQIIEEIGGDFFVIKPIDSSEGKGVLIIPKEQLDENLKKMILGRKALKNEKEKGFKFWETDHSDHFLVEEFVASDPVYPSHLGKKPYNGTMRVACLLVYHKKQIFLHYLGGYWILPEKGMEEEGSLSEKNLAYVFGKGYYCDVAKETLKEVENQLKEPLTLMYQRMLGLIPKQLEELGIGQGGSFKFSSGASDHCREARHE